MIEEQPTRDTLIYTYSSLEEWVEAARANKSQVPHAEGDEFTMYTSFDHACDLATSGWQDGLAEATPITESALQTIDREMELPSFQAEYLLMGSEVDVGRFLQGVPECMVEYEHRRVSKVGTVVTLCASLSVSSAVSTDTMVKRGAAVVGLATALERCGHATEIYASVDISQNYRDPSGKHAAVRVLVKGAHDEIDPSRLAFALAHPAMLRQLAFGVEHSLPRAYQTALRVGTGYGVPEDPIRTLPEGTIYLPCVLSNSDVPDADRFIAETLRGLGLVS